MLNQNQIKALAKIAGLRLNYIDDVPVSVLGSDDRYIQYPYEDFKSELELDDIRLQWLLGMDNFVAGGSVLNWIWGEDTNQDVDFFFRQGDKIDTFTAFIESIGFVYTRDTMYAKTYFEPNDNLVIQVVGHIDDSHTTFYSFGHPTQIIDRFDIHLCKFAVDKDYVYMSTQAVRDLLKLTVDATGHEKPLFINRLFKYIQKGFYCSPRIRMCLKYDKPQRKQETMGKYYETW